MNKSDETGDQVCRVVLKGSLTTDQAAQIRDQLLGALAEAEQVEINLSDAEDLDLPCMQVLCAAHSSAHRQGKKMTVHSVQEKLAHKLSLAGLANHPLFLHKECAFSALATTPPAKSRTVAGCP